MVFDFSLDMFGHGSWFGCDGRYFIDNPEIRQAGQRCCSWWAVNQKGRITRPLVSLVFAERAAIIYRFIGQAAAAASGFLLIPSL
jgi:hypothetical protein